MYVSNNFTKNNVGNIDLIDPTRAEDEIVLSIPYPDFHTHMWYTNDGINMTIKYNDDYSDKTVITSKKMTKEEFKCAKEEYIQALKDAEEYFSSI